MFYQCFYSLFNFFPLFFLNIFFFQLVWLALNIFLFAYDYYNYETATKYTYLRKIVGVAILTI